MDRNLHDDELLMCQRVFGDVLPRAFLKSKVLLANGLGAGGRPFTSIDVGTSTCRIYIGPRAWEASARTELRYKGTFVHEMTHVWQMHVDSWFGGVWFNSLKSQACHQGMAYWYGEGNLNKPWDSFNVEAQAQIVEDWFKGGLKESDPRFHYIRDDIRKGKPGFAVK